MKKILIPIFVLNLLACSSPSETTDANTQPSPTKVYSNQQTIDSIDAVSSATSKANEVSFNGTIVLPPLQLATVALTMSGIVRNSSLLPGQMVKKGDLLATLENSDFINLQQTFMDSYAQVEYLKAEYERQKMLASEQAASQKKLQQTKADYISMKSRMEGAVAQLSLLNVSSQTILTQGIQPLLEVKAPISGYIGNVNINIGKYVTAGEALCEIIDKSAPLLKLTTYEKDVIDIKMGGIVEFRANGMGDKTFKATVISIGQKVDEVSRSLEVYARITNPNSQFRPGMYVVAHMKK